MTDGSLLCAWEKRGTRLTVGKHRVFAVDLGPPEAPPLLILHGFPSSSCDFHRVVDRLAESFRVIAHDHLGFGLSDKPSSFSYSLMEQADVALGVWRELGIERGHLLAHDYGTSIATELVARRELGLLPIQLDSLTLSNGSILIELAHLRLSQRIARSELLGPLFGRLVFKGYLKRVLRGLWGDPRRAIDADLDAIWDGIVVSDGRRRVHALSGYIDERYRFHERWVGALERTDLATLVLWARRDPVAVEAIGRELARRIPQSSLVWLDKLGHYPMLEEPDAWALPVLAFLGSLAPSESRAVRVEPHPEG